MRARLVFALLVVVLAVPLVAQRTAKPVLHGRHWVAITGKPLAATAGAMMFERKGNAVDAACAMLAATATMWDTLGWGGETQALIYNPQTKKVLGINALGVAPTGATPEFFRQRKMDYPPEYGPLAAVTPGTPGGLMVMLAEFGTLRLADVLAPAIQMADGYPIEAQAAGAIERTKAETKKWPSSVAVFLTHPGEAREAPAAGEVFRQPDLKATLEKLVEAERQALAVGKDRRAAIRAAYDRFYKGDIGQEYARGAQELGGLVTAEDLVRWQVRVEEPVSTDYKGIQVYKLTAWTQGPALLQALNMLEGLDIKGMGYNSARYTHALYQVMSLAFADRDFYYGDTSVPPEEPVAGLLSKAYARERVKSINWDRNDPHVRPGDPYPFQGGTNPYTALLRDWDTVKPGGRWAQPPDQPSQPGAQLVDNEPFLAGTTSIQVREDGTKVIINEPSEARSMRLSGRLLATPDPMLAEAIERLARERDLEPRLVQAVVQVESGYNRRARSNKGAIGLMQLMPGTASDLAVSDPWDPEQNLRGGTSYLRQMIDRFGDIELALAAYNAGPEAVAKYGGIPPYEETRNYVRRILHLFDGSDATLDGSRVFIVRDANNQVRLTTSSVARP